MISIIHHIDIPINASRDALGVAELPGSVAYAAVDAAPFCDELAIKGELLDAVVCIFGHIHIPTAVHRDEFRRVELSVAVAPAAPFCDKLSVGGEFLDADNLSYIYVPIAVHRDAIGAAQILITGAKA